MDINISLLMVTADIISLMLLGTLYFSNKQRMSQGYGMHYADDDNCCYLQCRRNCVPLF